MALPAGISPATWRFEAARSDGLSYGSIKWGRRRDSHSRGAMRPAVYETAAVAAEPHRRNGGSPRCCPVLCGANANAKAELNRRNQACEVLTDTRIRVARNVRGVGTRIPG